MTSLKNIVGFFVVVKSFSIILNKQKIITNATLLDESALTAIETMSFMKWEILMAIILTNIYATAYTTIETWLNF